MQSPGRVKGAAGPARHLITIRDTLALFPLSAGDRVLSILPLVHIMAIQASPKVGAFSPLRLSVWKLSRSCNESLR